MPPQPCALHSDQPSNNGTKARHSTNFDLFVQSLKGEPRQVKDWVQPLDAGAFRTTYYKITAKTHSLICARRLTLLIKIIKKNTLFLLSKHRFQTYKWGYFKTWGHTLEFIYHGCAVYKSFLSSLQMSYILVL